MVGESREGIIEIEGTEKGPERGLDSGKESTQAKRIQCNSLVTLTLLNHRSVGLWLRLTPLVFQ